MSGSGTQGAAGEQQDKSCGEEVGLAQPAREPVVSIGKWSRVSGVESDQSTFNNVPFWLVLLGQSSGSCVALVMLREKVTLVCGRDRCRQFANEARMRLRICAAGGRRCAVGAGGAVVCCA